MLGDPAGFIFADPHGDAMSFNALDALLYAYECATSHGIPKHRVYRVAIVPTSDPNWTARTTASGAYSLIWLPVNLGNPPRNYMFSDQTILHEYATSLAKNERHVRGLANEPRRMLGRKYGQQCEVRLV